MRAEFLLSQWKGRSPRGQRPNRSQGSSCDPFSCTDITLLTVTRRDKSSPQCHIRMTGDWSRVRTWERARSQRPNPLRHMCFHKNMASSFQREVWSMSLLITHMYAMYSVNPTLSLTGPGWPPIINDAGVMMRLTVWSRSEMWNIMRAEFDHGGF